jgi:hypothetical protein
LLQSSKIIRKLSWTKKVKHKIKIRIEKLKIKMKKNNLKLSSKQNKFMHNKCTNKMCSKKKMKNSVEQMFFKTWIHKSWKEFQHRHKMTMLMMKLMPTKLLILHLMKTKALKMTIKMIFHLKENNNLYHNKKMITIRMILKLMDLVDYFKS